MRVLPAPPAQLARPVAADWDALLVEQEESVEVPLDFAPPCNFFFPWGRVWGGRNPPVKKLWSAPGGSSGAAEPPQSKRVV